MLKRRLCGTSILWALLAVAGAQGATFTLDSSADTWTARYDLKSHGAEEYIIIQGGQVDRVGYVRFDLSALNVTSIESAELVFTLHGSVPKPPYRNDTINTDRIAVYGLNDVSGNTPQNWSEATLNSSTIGVEIDWVADTMLAASGRVTDLDGDVNGVTEIVVPAAAGGSALGTKVVLTGDALARFIKTRAKAGGWVTFILRDDDSADRGFGFCSKEYADVTCRPMLEISGKIARKPTVAYVTSAKDNDEDGVQDDEGWVDWLKAEGCKVDIRNRYYGQPLTADETAELEAADLIVASRGLDISAFDGTEAVKWNALTKPILCMNTWTVRSDLWKWINSTDVCRDAGAPQMLVMEPNHPFFAGIVPDAAGCVQALDANVASGHTAFFNNVTDVGNGKMLSVCRGVYASAWIVEWAAGVEYYPGAGAVAGGPRVLFLAGTQDYPYTNDAGLTMPVGVFNLTATGQRILRNAINYLLPKDSLIGDP